MRSLSQPADKERPFLPGPFSVEHAVKDDNKPILHENDAQRAGSTLSRWRWRPGMKPRVALNVGVLFSVVGLLFVVIGLATLIAGILDSNSPPLRVSGVVTGYTTNFLDNLPHVIVRVEKEGSTTIIAPAVTPVTAQTLHIGDHVILDYSQRLHFPYALESGGQRYLLPGTSSAGNPIGSVALVLLGLLILPYPAFLAFWGWRDLQAQDRCTMTARIVGLRTSKQTRSPQPGLTSRMFRSSFTVALEPADPATFHEVVTFVLKEEMFRSLRVGTVVEVMYSPNLHYVYALKQADVGGKKNP
jgi:hypothetical protein